MIRISSKRERNNFFPEIVLLWIWELAQKIRLQDGFIHAQKHECRPFRDGRVGRYSGSEMTVKNLEINMDSLWLKYIDNNWKKVVNVINNNKIDLLYFLYPPYPFSF